MSTDREAEGRSLAHGILVAGGGPRPSCQPATPEPSTGVPKARVGSPIHRDVVRTPT